MNKKCTKCSSSKTIKRGIRRKIQTYFCKECGAYFSDTRRNKTGLQENLWKEYVFRKQTIIELSKEFILDKRTIKNHLNTYRIKEKIHNPRKIHLIVDGTYFGERIEDTTWCVVVGRCQYTKENLWWGFCDSETTSIYRQMRADLESLGYEILSITGDGFGGIRQAFSDIPFQMCQVHMERLVIKGTTKNPQTEAGVVLLALARTLKDTDSHTFRVRMKTFFDTYHTFLNEKTIHPISGESSYTHEGIVLAFKSLANFEKFLFTYEHNKKIPKTTNSLEGHFRHIKRVVNVHCGLGREHKEKVLSSLLLAGTVAPTDERLDEIL